MEYDRLYHKRNRKQRSSGTVRLIFVAEKTPAGLSLAMAKKEKKPISIGPQFYTLLALTDTIVAELRWGKKKNNRVAKIADPLTLEPRLMRKRLSGKLKIERL
jgi:hypothetical protein